jgi:hypothetical protein
MLVSVDTSYVTVWDIKTRAEIAFHPIKGRDVLSVCCNPDNEAEFSTLMKDSVKFWKVEVCGDISSLISQ